MFVFGVMFLFFMSVILLQNQKVNAQEDTDLISDEFTVNGQTIFVNFTYELTYNKDQNTTFYLDVKIDLGAIVVNYLQIFYKPEDTGESYQFLFIVGDVATPSNTINISLTGHPINTPYSANNAKFWFQMGYHLNGNTFGQYSSKSIDKFVEIHGLDPNDGEEEGSGIWFLFWEFPTVGMAILVNGLIIGGIVGIIVFLQKRKKQNQKKSKKLEKSNGK